MKTAMELIEHRSDDDDCKCLICTSCVTCDEGRQRMLELVAKRAREEAYALAAQHVETRIGSWCEWTADHALRHVAANIRALPVEAKS